MMSPRTVRVVTVLIVVAFVAVTVLAAMPAGAAEPFTRAPGTVQSASHSTARSAQETVQETVQQSAKRASALTRARAKQATAKRQVKRADRARVRAVTAAAAPARAYEAAVGEQARAQAAVAETQTALEVATAVLAGESARRADITSRYEAAKVQFDAAAAAYRTSGEQMAALRTAQTALVEQLNGVYASVKAAAATVADVELVRIPAAAGAVTAAWRAEQKARSKRVGARERFTVKKAELGSCRHVKAGGKKGGWQCVSGGRWRDAPALDGLAKKMTKAARGYAKAKKVRRAQEAYLTALKGELGQRRNELAAIEASAKDLDGQVATGRAAVSAAEQETSRLRVVADEWDKALDGIVAEGEKFTAEVDAARAQQPELAAKVAPLTAVVTAAQAQVAATQGAHAAAQAQVAVAKVAVAKAKRVLARATKRVKSLSRHR